MNCTHRVHVSYFTYLSERKNERIIMSKKILLIEDEILIQKSIKKFLEMRGANVEVFSSGTKAIQAIFDNDYDKVICDLTLDDISGFDVIEESTKKYSREIISQKFIIITAYSSPQILERANQYLCKVVSKPFTNLEETLNLFLN